MELGGETENGCKGGTASWFYSPPWGHEVVEEAGSDPRARQEPLLSRGCDAVPAQPGRGVYDGKGVCAGGAVPNLALG